MGARIRRQLLLAACIEVQRLCHGGGPGPEVQTNMDYHERFYPDGATASVRDFLFPDNDFDEGERLADEVAALLGEHP